MSTVSPPAYGARAAAPSSDRFAQAITGPARIVEIAGAGHLTELDKPAEVAAAITDWMGGD